jgi:hypothetical protein
LEKGVQFRLSALVAEEAFRGAQQAAQSASRGLVSGTRISAAEQRTQDALELGGNFGLYKFNDNLLGLIGLVSAQAGFLLQQIGDFTHVVFVLPVIFEGWGAGISCSRGEIAGCAAFAFLRRWGSADGSLKVRTISGPGCGGRVRRRGIFSMKKPLDSTRSRNGNPGIATAR